MQECDAVVGEKCAQLVEEGRVIGHADMLEHPDRHDAVERAAERTVIYKLEAAALRKAGILSSAPCGCDLLLRQRHTQHIGAAVSCEIECEPAPARTYVEDSEARRVEVELGGNVPFLADLRFFERFTGRGKIRAGILAVAIEEEIVELPRKVVMMGDVSARARGIIELGKPAGNPTPDSFNLQHAPWRGKREIVHQKVEKVGDVAV